MGLLGLQGNPLAISNVASSIIVYVRVRVWGTSAEQAAIHLSMRRVLLLHCAT